jgi:EAL domain-containing protein (putative c-di-GMP-specific phosphodiesterase class I)
MQAADLAMYRAKGVDDRVAIHGDDGDEAPHSRFELEVDLWQAAKRDELVLQYQPVLELASGDVVGAEALVRWHHPQSGLVPPGDFIALAEESGAIVEIDCWVARRALEQLASWRAQGFNGSMAINASARTLGEDRYLEALADALEGTGVSADHVIVEVTESAAMKDPERVRERLDDLTHLGVAVALDDFGMGYSSLAYLKELPASRIKIDRSFIRGIGHHARDEQVVELVLKIAESFELEVVAEGVEDPSQSSWLEGRGCQLVQGFHYGRPAAPERLLALAQGSMDESGANPKSGRRKLEAG